ncbi:hypothetical protein OXX59_007373 [Metschnikowia pulcherrima]
MPPRSRNFNGCWTCRMRKIKCDAVRPKCLRCQKANLECKGYDLVLTWADVSTLDGDRRLITLTSEKSSDAKKENGSSRRSVALVNFPKSMLYETYDNLNRIVARFEDPEVVHNSLIVGPFSVFPLDAPGESRKALRPSPKNSDYSTGESGVIPAKHHVENNGFSSAVSVSEVLESDFESSIFSKTNNAYVHYDLLEFAKLTILAIKGPRHKFDEQGMFHILYPKFFPNVESDNWRPSDTVLSTFFWQDDKSNIILGPSMSTSMRHLMESFRSSMKVAHNKNPWEKLVMPFIKQLFFEIVCEEYPKAKSWKSHIIGKGCAHVSRELLLRNMKFAIFCMCLSIGWHERSLSGLKVRNSIDTFFVNDELKVSIELRKIGINILNYHLDEYDANSDYQPQDDYDSYFLLALILQIHLDNLFGVFENYELMYAIGDFILKKPKALHQHMSSLERQLRHTFNILNIFYESTQSINLFNYSIPDKDQKSKYSDLSENYDLTKEGTIREMCLSTDESDEGIGTDDDEEIDVKVKAVASKSESLSFTVNFKGDKKQKVAHTDPMQTKNLGFKSFQAGLPEKPRFSNPVIPSLDDGSVFSSFGLPRALLRLVQEVVHLTNHKNVFKSRVLAPRNFPRICAETEDKILNFNVENYWKLYDNEYNPITNVATKTFISEYHEGLYHNVICFHNALIVYFKRLIPETPIQDSQSFIEKCFFHMEKLITLNSVLKAKRKDLQFNPLFWPLLVSGCDIDLSSHGHLKVQCQRFWKADCFQRFNYWRSKQILFEVWYRREQDGENNSFMDMIREWEIVLSLG